MALRALLALAYFTAHLSALRSHEARAPNVTDLAFKNTDFAMNLYRKISSFHDRNIFFSPLSISTSFSTLLLAAKGPTRTEILKGLNLEALDGDATLIPGLFQQLQGNMSQDGALRVEQDTALFLHPSLRLHSAFVQQAQSYFGVELQRLDFSRPDAKSLLNQHVSQKTGHRVQEMVESLEPLTQMMLLNTIFYQGEWERPFDPNSTAMSRFYVDKYNVVQVPMMLKEDQFWTAEDAELQARVLRLPYGGGTALLLVLPEPSADYTAVEDEISAARLRRWTRSLRRRKMEVQLPRFRLDQSYRLHEVLPHLGIRSVFQDSADLTGLSQDAHLRVSQVLHKAVIQVDEKGTTAASASSVGITAYSLPVTFILNRPFFFFLYHEATSSLLFMGRVIDPTKN